MPKSREDFLMSRTGTYKSICDDKLRHRRDGMLPVDLGVRDVTALDSVFTAIGSAVDGRASSIVTVRGTSQHSASLVQVRPAREAGWAVVSRSSLDQAPEMPDPKVLQELWDLTPTEVLVATDLLRHEDLSDIAQSRGGSVETIRMHVKNILRKTGMPSQKKLVGLLTRLAALTVHNAKQEKPR
jgi:DNA-binding CsgD family transcriptional regulator